MADRRLAEIEERLARFRDDRDWRRFHSLGNLAAAISVEAGELLDHLLWSPPRSEQEIVAKRQEEIEAELADVVIQCLNFAAIAGIDTLAAVERKIAVNEERYPVDRSRGRAEKHTDL
jgi:NTP pyrophosphatase (non-canonical NTP hydrolase)